ncbi:hypothetical protein C8R46DRAFT_1238478 [Mycena filopes]|nr:hypothetical protein C8R46DRAFT_1238478 [Mycena filopes]
MNTNSPVPPPQQWHWGFSFFNWLWQLWKLSWAVWNAPAPGSMHSERVCERWAFLDASPVSTKFMPAGSRRDSLHEGLIDWNATKLARRQAQQALNVPAEL